MPTNLLALLELNLLYSSEGEITSLDRTKLGTSPVSGQFVDCRESTKRKENLSNVSVTSFELSSFFKSIEE